MLGESAFSEWHARLGLSAQTVKLIESIRSSPPVRRVSSGRGSQWNVSARFPSVKMGHVIQAESRTIELAFLRQAEHDLDVLELWDQPSQMELHYPSRNGRAVVAKHTPDFFVLRQGHAEWVECKPLEKLIALHKTEPNRYLQNDKGTWICPPGVTYANQRGLTYTVITEEHLDKVLVRNYEYLDDYYRQLAEKQEAPALPPSAVDQLLAAVNNQPGITKADIARLDPSIKMDVLHWLMVLGEVYVDLRRCPLADANHVRIYRDSEQAQMYELCAKPAHPAWLTGGGPLRCEPGTPLDWEGKPWKIINVGDTNIYLQIMDGSGAQPILMKPTKLRELVMGGHIKTVRVENDATEGDQESDTETQRRFLSGAHPKVLARALERYRHLRRFEAGDITILHETSLTTLYRCQRRWREAEAGGSPGFVGLLDEYANCGRAEQLGDATRDLLLTSVREDYHVKQQPRIRVAYDKYRGRCKEASAVAASYETYRNTVHRETTADRLASRRGRRAAYAASPFVSLNHGNRHGDFPMQRVHIDHTQLDIEVITPLGENLGRPWFSPMFDAYARRVLGFYLTFDPPSYRTCMMAVREFVRRNGRLPMTLIYDNGAEFRSVYFESMLAAYHVTAETRPAAKARFGSVIERMFGTTNSEFIHTLRGNTQITRNVREVTKSVDPRGQAVWTLPGLQDALAEWCFEVYDQKPHSGLHGRSPRAVFLAGQEQAGTRDDSAIAYDQEFLIATAPTTPKGTVKVGPNGVVKVHYILYAGDVLCQKGVPGTDIPVRYDPENMGHIYVCVDNTWTECLANNFDIFGFRSEREIALASEEIRRLDQLAGRTAAVSDSKLIEFFQHLDEHENVLLQHKRDQEELRARAGNAFNLDAGTDSEDDDVGAEDADGISPDASAMSTDMATSTNTENMDAARNRDASSSDDTSRTDDDNPDLCEDF